MGQVKLVEDMASRSEIWFDRLSLGTVRHAAFALLMQSYISRLSLSLT